MKKTNKNIKNAKDITGTISKKPVKKIIEHYYFNENEISSRELMKAVGDEFADKTDIWPELNLMEIEMAHDSLIFQDATECFVDPLDMEWFGEHGIKSKYVISYDSMDIEAVRKAMINIMGSLGGMVCSDTDDFLPSWDRNNIDEL